MRALQEEHVDLLGMLAQQEVEVSFYRLSLRDAIGLSSLTEIDLKVKNLVIRKYGSYTEYRNTAELLS
jgi:hypothetical protein